MDIYTVILSAVVCVISAIITNVVLDKKREEETKEKLDQIAYQIMSQLEKSDGSWAFDYNIKNGKYSICFYTVNEKEKSDNEAKTE